MLEQDRTPEDPNPAERELPITREERREEKLRKKKEQMAQHGKALSQTYKNAVEKRAEEKGK